MDPQITMDRLVSASSGDDALRCLQDLLEASVPLEVVLEHPDCVVHILHLLQSREFKSTGTSLATSDEADIVHAILKLYQGWAPKNSQCLLQPEPGRLLEALLDVVDVSQGEGGGSPATTTTTLPPYIRVLALQLLHQLLQQHETMALEQWLQAPNGLHRLLEQLWVGTSNVSTSGGGGGARALDEEEAVRVQALEVAHLLAQKSPAIAKIFLFDEVESQLLDVFWKIYGGLTSGHGFVADGLTLIHTCLLHQASDASLMELIWQRPTVPMRLAQLLDLRGGYAFLHPNENVPQPQKAKNNNTSKSTTSGTSKSPKLGPLSRRNKPRVDEEDHDDDLDSLLQSATTPQKGDSSGTQTVTASGTASTTTTVRAEYPQLLESEEVVISRVLQIIDVLLEPHELREQVWTKYAPALTTFCWELALMVPPPPGAPAYFALPSSFLQRTALQLVATKMASPTIMDRMNGLDRLLNVVCTGGGLATSLHDRMGCSQAALHVMRKILDPPRIHILLLHTLAPPPLPDQEDHEALPPSPTVVQKLWNTVAEHLDPTTTTATDSTPDPDTDSRTIFVSGALGALAVFCVDAESREMLVQSTPPLASIEQMLEVLSQQQQQETVDEASSVSATSRDSPTLRQVRTYALYRFLLQYIHETPALVLAVLSSPASIHLATLATTPSTFQPLTLLLLGLCLEFFPAASSECGGWTTASLLQVFQGMSIPKATKLMQGFLEKGHVRTTIHNKMTSVSGSFLVCELESNYWQEWYQQALWTVRKRLVKELAGNGGSSMEEGEDEGDKDVKDATQKIKPLQIMIAQQSTELEDLRLQLEQANTKMKIQDSQLETWERRMRSNPTQLDGILNELTQKASTMEGEIARLESLAQQAAEQHRKDLAIVTEQLEEQRDDASRLRISTQEALDDRDRMEQELSALSQAYSNLEDEFRRSTSAPVDASMRTSSSTEVLTLRAENDRLRASAKDADEWMAQAYQKMAELGTQNGDLKGEVLSLKEQLTRAASTYETSARKEMDQVAQQNLNLQEQLTLLQGQLQGSQSEVSSLHEQVQQAAISNEQWQQGYEALEQSRLALQAQISATDSAHVAHIEELEGRVQAQSQEIVTLQALLDDARQSAESSTKADLTETESKLKAVMRELESVRSRSEEEIYKRESVIRELESRLGSGLGTYTVKDIRSREQEIEELRAANDAAQEWMGKAVEQHRILQEKVWAAANASDAPSTADDARILELKEAIAGEEGRHEETRQLVHDLEKKLDDERNENERLQKELSLALKVSQGKALSLTCCDMIGQVLISKFPFK